MPSKAYPLPPPGVWQPGKVRTAAGQCPQAPAKQTNLGCPGHHWEHIPPCSWHGSSTKMGPISISSLKWVQTTHVITWSRVPPLPAHSDSGGCRIGWICHWPLQWAQFGLPQEKEKGHSEPRLFGQLGKCHMGGAVLVLRLPRAITAAITFPAAPAPMTPQLVDRWGEGRCQPSPFPIGSPGVPQPSRSTSLALQGSRSLSCPTSWSASDWGNKSHDGGGTYEKEESLHTLIHPAL